MVTTGFHAAAPGHRVLALTRPPGHQAAPRRLNRLTHRSFAGKITPIMALGIDAKNDYAFKYVFGSEQRTGILIHMLNAVLKPPPGRRVESVVIRNPISEQVILDDKLSILDIKASDQSGRQFNVEMQMTIPPNLPGRLLYYWSKLYSGQLTTGEEYDLLQPVISICFLDGVLFRQVEGCHLHFQLCEVQRQILFTDQIEVHLFQLPLFTKMAEELQDPLEKWLYFLNNAQELDPAHLPASLQEVPISEAVRALDMLTQDEVERERYEAREKAKRDHLSWEKALQRAQQETARLQQERDNLQQESERLQQEKDHLQQESEHLQQESEHLQQQAAVSREAGVLIGQIQLCQQLLQQPVTPQEVLQNKPLDELRHQAEQLRQKLAG